MKLNNKGFSLIEILAVVVILGIVSTIGIVSVTKLIEKSKTHYYETEQNQIVLAAQSYFSDHKELLPKLIGSKKTVSLQDLYNNNYIKEQIKDKNGKVCYPGKHKVKDENGNYIKNEDGTDLIEEGSRVDIYKSNQTEYTYVGYLECDACLGEDEEGNKKTSCYSKESEEEPYVNIEIDPVPSNKIMDKNKEIKIHIKGNESDSNILIASYSYKIYVNNALKFSSGLKINNKKPNIDIAEKLYKYVPGNVKVEVTVTNNKGITKTVSKSENYSDVSSPLCGQVKYDAPNAMKTYNHKDKKPDDLKCGTEDYKWVNIENLTGTRHVWVLCDDELGLGCSQTEFSKLFTTDGENEDITLKDVNGYSVACPTKKCIDKSTIKLTVNIKNGNTVKKTYTIDPQHKAKDYKPTEKYNEWLNKENYPNGVTVEVIINDGKDSKDDSSLIKNFSWYQNTKDKKESAVTHTTSVTEKIQDNKNMANRKECKGIEKSIKKECKEYKYSKTITEDGVRREVIKAEDYAGNIVTYSLILKIDRTPPTVPKVTGYKKTNKTDIYNESGLKNYTYDSWYNKYELNKASGSVDKPDVSGFKKYQYTAWGATKKSIDADGTYRNINAEGTSKIKYRSCDFAGNCSDYSGDKIVLLDHTEPTCNVSEEGGTEGNNGWYRGGTVKAYTNCKDQTNLSGCDPSYTRLLIHSINSDTAGTTNSKTIKDIAGNTKSCSNTIKYDKSSPSCTIGDNDWTEGGVTLKTTCSDDGPSGVASSSCKKQYDTTTTGKHTHNVTDNAGNSGSCSTTVSSKRQESIRTRTWNTCKTGSPNECVGGTVSKTCNGVMEVGANGAGSSCGPKTGCGKGQACKSCQYDCSYYDSCKSTKNTCVADWNSWGDYGSWSKVDSCKAGKYNAAHGDYDHQRQCRTMYKNS